MKKITREEAIEDLRARFLTLTDDEHSMCDVAARLNIFCGGFAQWTFLELKKRYPQIVRSRPHIPPAELRELANRWQLARQTAQGTQLSCDTQMLEDSGHQACQGWRGFSNEDLARFHRDICGEAVEVVAAAGD